MSKAKQTNTTKRVSRRSAGVAVAKRNRTSSCKSCRAATLKTVPAVIKAFGGEAEIAAWAGTERSWVRNWKRWGFISPAWHWRMMIRLTELGYEVDPEVFGAGDAEVWKRARPFGAAAAARA